MAYYAKEEQETVIIYEPTTNQWDIYTNVPKHMKSFKKRLYSVSFSRRNRQ
ncbi:hypothetical protein [Bacillus mobilis]|uniref:hypothetical protein n=1 Tax=Bacillus mobilis TaxID=2026190 RepID=UPI0036AF7733